MSDIIEVGSDKWTISHDIFNLDLSKKLRFNGSTSVFSVNRQLFIVNDSVNCVVLTVLAESSLSHTIEYRIHHHGLELSFEGKLTETKTGSPPLYCINNIEGEITLELKLTHIDDLSFGGFFTPLKSDLESYIERGPIVTLIGNDGTVSVPRRILELRSKALEVMFDHDSKEKQTGQIELKDFNSKTLEAFACFLMTGEIVNGKETALGLIVLGDKYDIKGMKTAGENFVLENIAQMNKNDVIEVFSKVSVDLVYDAIVAWSKK